MEKLLAIIPNHYAISKERKTELKRYFVLIVAILTVGSVFAHHNPPPPQHPRHHTSTDCNIISGVIGFIGGVFTGVGLAQKEQPKVIVVRDDLSYLPPSNDILPKVNPTTTTTVTTVDKKHNTITTTTTTIQPNPNSRLVWVEGYWVEKRRGNYVESTYIPGHWENR